VRIVDTSAWVRRHHPEVDTWFSAAFLAGDLAICDMVALEILSGAPNRRWYERMRDLLSGAPWIGMGRAEWARAMEVHWMLERDLGTNARRGVKHADLLIAAAAEAHGLELVHYDQDFDLIQRVTQQPMQWAAPRGSL
jgi:predicted nucleic acid-binding protein